MKNKPVLVVEDDRDIRENLKDILEAEGYPVALACNGREGVEYVRSHRLESDMPGLVLLDLMMPVMTGEEFIEEIKADPFPELNQLPILVLTASAGRMIAGVPFMRKPVNIDLLLVTVERHCAAS